MHDKGRKLRQNAWTSADETVQSGKMWKRRAKNPEKNFLIWIKFSFFFTAARPISETRKYKFRARRAPKSAPLEYSQRTGAMATIRRCQPRWRQGRKICESARTYVRFSCCSFASVSGAAVILPQCSRSSLSHLPSPAAIVASPGSSADLRTKRSHGVLWLDSTHNRISVWRSCGQPAIWGVFWGFVCFNVHFVVKINFLFLAD